MTDLKWRGLSEGYVSSDARFLVAPVLVPGKKGTRKAWALYGRVLLQAQGEVTARPPRPWGWTEEPLAVAPTKSACQRVAAGSDYEVGVTLLYSTDMAASGVTEKPMGYSICQECGVHFDRGEGHRYEDYCGSNCVATVAERVRDILATGIKVKDVDGQVLRVGPPRPNEPHFVPRRAE